MLMNFVFGKILNEIEQPKFNDDINTYGDYQSGEYKGISWEMKRNQFMGHWCGYVITNLEIDELTYNKLEEASYMGLTSHLGFDCAHYNDYPFRKNGTYKDYSFVLHIIKDMIDILI